MARAKKTRPFNVEVFLHTVDGGRNVSSYGKNQKEGKVKVCVVSERGKEAVVALHDKGDFFGEGCLNDQPLRLATVATMTDCVVATHSGRSGSRSVAAIIRKG